jgi:hypothetical protein
MADRHLGWYIKKLTKTTLVKSGGLRSGTFRFTAFLCWKWIETVQFDNPPNLTSVESSSKWQVVLLWSSRKPCNLTNWDLDWDWGHIPPDARIWNLEFGGDCGGCLLLGKRKPAGEATWRGCVWFVRRVWCVNTLAAIGGHESLHRMISFPHFPAIYLERCALDTHASGIFWLATGM